MNSRSIFRRPRVLPLVIITVLFSILIGCRPNGISDAVNAQSDLPGEITKSRQELIFNHSKDLPNLSQLSIAFTSAGLTTYYGIVRENDTIRSTDNRDSLFEIGSLTKLFTAALLADEVVHGGLSLDDPIINYMQVPLKDSIATTFLELSNHTSGLPRLPPNLHLDSVDILDPYKDYDEEMLEAYLRDDLKLYGTPGTEFQYSNLGVGLLGYILAKMDSTTYEELLQTKIFLPLGMQNSTTILHLAKSKLVTGLDLLGNKTPHWSINALVAAGGIMSSTQDMSRFAQANFGDENKVFLLTRQPTFQIPRSDNAIGLGWFIEPKTDSKWLSHGGGTGGYTSYLIVDSDRRKSVVILSNVSAFSRTSKNIVALSTELMNSISR